MRFSELLLKSHNIPAGDGGYRLTELSVDKGEKWPQREEQCIVNPDELGSNRVQTLLRIILQ